MPLHLSTHNPGKRKEILSILPHFVKVRDEFVDFQIPDETGNTLRENALIKALAGVTHSSEPCLADDSGLEVFSLGYAPGVHSSSYGGIEGDAQRNMSKLLGELKPGMPRGAKFVTVLCLAFPQGSGIDPIYAEGEVNGLICTYTRGNGGFGYDPIFIPQGEMLTFAQMTKDQKNSMSHRANAMQKLLDMLEGSSEEVRGLLS